MDGVIDIKGIRLKCQPHVLTEVKFPPDAQIHARIMRGEQTKWSRARDVADGVRHRVNEGSLIEIGCGGNTPAAAPKVAINPDTPVKSRIVIRIARAEN